MKFRRAAFFVLFGCFALCLTGCKLIDKLGFDTYDYMSEKVLSTHEADSKIAAALEEFFGILITDSIDLSLFEKMNESTELYRDAVLTYMLDTGYSKYSGNKALIEEAAKKYPGYNITLIIPESEFEATMYRIFGGSVMITHKDSTKFKYLSKVGAYISPMMPMAASLEAKVTTIYETEKTYRVWFKVVGENLESKEYFALIIKREDGTFYIKKLLMGERVGK